MSDIKGTPFGWDPEKKRQRDEARDIEIMRKRVGDAYSSWNHTLCKRARTRREIIQFLYDLQKTMDELERAAGKLADVVFPWKGTREMIGSKITILTAAQICAENTAIQHIPATLQLRTDDQVIEPKKVKFRTVKEFEEIDFIKHFSEQPGFMGFYAKMSMESMDIKYFIIAHYGSDSCIACELLNDTCLDDFAQYDDVPDDQKPKE